jgi:hypothetical protein
MIYVVIILWKMGTYDIAAVYDNGADCIKTAVRLPRGICVELKK